MRRAFPLAMSNRIPEHSDDLRQLLVKAGLGNMTTLRDLQAGILQALEEVKERDEVIQELKSTLGDRDRCIADLTRELNMLKAVLDNPLSETNRSEQPSKRIAISAAPVDVDNSAGSASYAKIP